jgi:hypothetical protein
MQLDRHTEYATAAPYHIHFPHYQERSSWLIASSHLDSVSRFGALHLSTASTFATTRIIIASIAGDNPVAVSLSTMFVVSFTVNLDPPGGRWSLYMMGREMLQCQILKSSLIYRLLRVRFQG